MRSTIIMARRALEAKTKHFQPRDRPTIDRRYARHQAVSDETMWHGAAGSGQAYYDTVFHWEQDDPEQTLIMIPKGLINDDDDPAVD